MAAESVFIDTNVLVYATWSGATRHDDARGRLDALARQGYAPCFSRQILREFLAVVTRPQGEVTPMAVDEAVETVRSFGGLIRVFEDGSDVAERLLELALRYDVKGRQIHDANIVATMSVHGIRRLLTANPADFRRFADIIDIEPL